MLPLIANPLEARVIQQEVNTTGFVRPHDRNSFWELLAQIEAVWGIEQRINAHKEFMSLQVNGNSDGRSAITVWKKAQRAFGHPVQ